VTETWDPAGDGVLRLPSGRLVRGRGLYHAHGRGAHSPSAAHAPEPGFGLYVLGRRPPETTWPMRWLHWPDFWVPRDRSAAIEAITDAWDRTRCQRVEVACAGGRGRTGTVLSCMVVLDGVPNRAAVAYVRAHYDRKAVEMPWQRRFVETFPASKS